MWRFIIPLLVILAFPFVFGIVSVYVIASSSMEPSIPRLSLVFINNLQKPQPGEVGAYTDEEGNVIVHRFLHEDDEGRLVFKGDRNPAADDPVEKNRLRGSVVLVIPFLGMASIIIRNPIVLAMLAIFLIGGGRERLSDDKPLLIAGLLASIIAGPSGFPGRLFPTPLSPAINLTALYTIYKLTSLRNITRLERNILQASYLLLLITNMIIAVRWLLNELPTLISLLT